MYIVLLFVVVAVFVCLFVGDDVGVVELVGVDGVDVGDIVGCTVVDIDVLFLSFSFFDMCISMKIYFFIIMFIFIIIFIFI